MSIQPIVSNGDIKAKLRSANPRQALNCPRHSNVQACPTLTKNILEFSNVYQLVGEENEL